MEKKEGKLKGKKDVIITDLPGIYSLSPYTLEEVVSRDYILNEHPDVIVNLVDATNIERNLYLTTQLIETGVPVVIALNMADLLEKREIKIDTVHGAWLPDHRDIGAERRWPEQADGGSDPHCQHKGSGIAR